MNTEFVKERLAGLDISTGVTKVIGVRPTKNANEVQLVFAEKVERPSNRNAISDFMEGHEAFGGSRAQPVWVTSMLKNVKKLLPTAYEQAVQCIEEQDYVALDITNPMIGDKRLRLEITETHKPSTWERDNIEQAAKQDGEGNYLHWNGLAIFTSVDLVKGDPQHRFIQHTGMVTDVHSLDYNTEAHNAEALVAESASKAQDEQKELTEGAEATSEQEKAEAQPADA